MWETRLNVGKSRHVHRKKREGEEDVLIWKDEDYYHRRHTEIDSAEEDEGGEEEG